VASTTASSPRAIEQRFAPGLPLVRLDAEQIRRVIINLADNATRPSTVAGRSILDAQLDTATVVRVVVADDGRASRRPSGESCSCRTTQPRGVDGLGRAIVRRIIAEHGGSIEVGDNVPRGTTVYHRTPMLTSMSPTSGSWTTSRRAHRR